jgi:hypothetical protein
MLGKIAIFRGKSFEKSFFQQFRGIFRGKNVQKDELVKKCPKCSTTQKIKITT